MLGLSFQIASMDENGTLNLWVSPDLLVAISCPVSRRYVQDSAFVISLIVFSYIQYDPPWFSLREALHQ